MNSIFKVAIMASLMTAMTGVVLPLAASSSQVSAAETTPTQLLEQGRQKALRRDYQGAISLYNQALQANPKLTQAYLYRGIAYHDLGDFKQAILDFDQALKIEPRNPEILYNRAESRLDLNDFEGAKADMNEAIRLKPDYAEAYNNRGILYARLGDGQKSLADLDRAIQLKPDYADAYYNRGQARTNLGDGKGAIEDYTKAISFNPELGEAYGSRGILYFQVKGDKKAALDDLGKAAQLFEQQGDQDYYQRTLDIMQQIEQVDKSKG